MLEFQNNCGKDIVTFTVNDESGHETKWAEGLTVVYMLRGAAKVVKYEKFFVLGQEDFLVINPYEPYGIFAGKGTDVLCMRVAEPAAVKLMQDEEEWRFDCCSAQCKAYQEAYLGELRRLIASLFHASYKQPSVNSAYLYRELFSFVDILLRHFQMHKDNADISARSRLMEQFRTVLRYINANYREELTIGSVAKANFLSANSLSRYFQKYLQVTFTEYLTGVRLGGAYADLLHGKQRVTEIALENGFKSTNSFIKSFKKKYGLTPGQCREVIRKAQPDGEEMNKVVDSKMFQALLRHLDRKTEFRRAREAVDIPVQVDVGIPAIRGHGKWKNLLCIGYAKEGLLASVQRQLRLLQKEIGFSYISFHGLFDDDMLVYSEDADGTARFDFSMTDELIDFLLEIGLRPYLELGFTPTLLAQEEDRKRQPFRRSSQLCLPNNFDKWIQLVQAFVHHVEARYGAREVEKWYFAAMSIHCAVGSGQYAVDRQIKLYCQLYCRQYQAIKQINPNYKVAGPGLYSNALKQDYFIDFLKRCKVENCLPDQYTFLCFPYEPISDQDFFHKLTQDGAFPDALSSDEQYVEHFWHDFDALRASLGLEAGEVTLLEWNATMWQRDFCNDSCFKAAYLAKNIAENYDVFWGMGYWTANDMQEETAPGGAPFHGGYGLHTVQGIAKSAYNSLYLMNKMGTEVLGRGKGYMITRSGDSIQILCYNYCHYDALFQKHYMKDEKAEDCYDRFVEKDDSRFLFEISGLTAGEYRLRKWQVGREHGSAFDTWINMGEPDYLNPEEIILLKGASVPGYQVWKQEVKGDMLRITTQLTPHEIQLLDIHLEQYKKR